MGTGIQVCGLNGCGKSTLARALAQRLHFHYIDNEQLFFSRSRADEPYANPRTRQEAEQLLAQEVGRHPDFVFAAVRGDYGEGVVPLYDLVVAMEAPQPVRSQRIRSRSFQRFGDRMLAGGDLYWQEEAFLRMAESRQSDYVEAWLQTVKCPVLRVDGTRPIAENVEYIVRAIGR